MPSAIQNTGILKYKFENELTLNRSEFNTLDQRTDKFALAQTIQNILLFHKGNFPNQPQLGVGIEDYLFELANQDTIREIEDKINNQIKAFIPTDYNINFETQFKTVNKMSVLSLVFTLQDTSDGSITGFQLLFGKKDRESKVVSRLIA